MTALVNRFALIGRSFQSDSFEGLHQTVVAARAERRSRRNDRVTRSWHVAQDAIVLPKRLSA